MGTLTFSHAFASPWFYYFNASAGLANNGSHDYQELPRFLGAEPMSPYRNNTVSSLTYHFGLGITAYIDHSWSASVGYQFADFGQAQLGTSLAQSTNQRLTINHLYVNQILLSISLDC